MAATKKQSATNSAHATPAVIISLALASGGKEEAQQLANSRASLSRALGQRTTQRETRPALWAFGPAATGFIA